LLPSWELKGPNWREMNIQLQRIKTSERILELKRQLDAEDSQLREELESIKQQLSP
jgi:hypothetical protein